MQDILKNIPNGKKTKAKKHMIMPWKDSKCPTVVHSNNVTIYNLAGMQSALKILVNYNPGTKGSTLRRNKLKPEKPSSFIKYT